MARISTYTQDTTPHPGDHVIGTNAGSADESHRSETVTFSLSSLGDFILNTNVAASAGDTTVTTGGEGSTNVETNAGTVTTPATFRYALNYTTADFDTLPQFQIRHGLNTENVHIQIFIDIADQTINLPPNGSAVDWFSIIDDANTVTIIFAFSIELVGFVTISG